MIKVLYNPNQATGGLVQIGKVDSGCPACDNITPCKYTRANVTAGTVITSITFRSAKTNASVVKTIGAYTTQYQLQDLLRAAFESEGYTVQGSDAIQIIPNATTPANSDYIFIGEANVTFINALATTQTCNRQSVCTYTMVTEGGTAIPYVNDLGVSTDLTFGSGTAASAVTTLFANATTAEVSILTTKDVANVFTIQIKHLNNKNFSLDGDSFVKTDCYIDYV